MPPSPVESITYNPAELQDLGLVLGHGLWRMREAAKVSGIDFNYTTGFPWGGKYVQVTIEVLDEKPKRD